MFFRQKVTWLKDGTILDLTGTGGTGHPAGTKQRMKLSKSGSLSIDNVGKSDSGEYVCQVSIYLSLYLSIYLFI